MATVVNLAKHTKYHSHFRGDRLVPAPHFYCLKCNGETFTLFENSDVYCQQCGSFMKNLSAVMVPTKEPKP